MARVMRATALARYADVATELGLDPRAMLRAAGIDGRALAEGELRIPAEEVIELLERSAEVSGCETFGLRMGEQRRLSDHGPVSLLLIHQPTVRDAVMTFIRYQRLINDSVLLNLEDQPEDQVLLREEIVTALPQRTRQAYELTLAVLMRMLGAVGPNVKPQAVHFTHRAPSDLSLHRRTFGPNVHFDSSFNGMLWNRADLDAMNPTADPALTQHAEQFVSTLPYANHTSLSAEVQKAIHVLLPFNGATMARVASRLGYSERTLQRRLAEEGAEFSRLLNEIRRDHALRYLGNLRVPLSEVAALIGYGHETSFARWFAGEFGVTPSAWRTAPR